MVGDGAADAEMDPERLKDCRDSRRTRTPCIPASRLVQRTMTTRLLPNAAGDEPLEGRLSKSPARRGG
jgi:hypothetical protein